MKKTDVHTQSIKNIGCELLCEVAKKGPDGRTYGHSFKYVLNELKKLRPNSNTRISSLYNFVTNIRAKVKKFEGYKLPDSRLTEQSEVTLSLRNNALTKTSVTSKNNTRRVVGKSIRKELSPTKTSRKMTSKEVNKDGSSKAKEVCKKDSARHYRLPTNRIVSLNQFIEYLEQQGWDKIQLQKPETVYQVSLRLGIPFKETISKLVQVNLIDKKLYNKLKKINPKNIKIKLLKQHVPSNSEIGEVWHLTEHDDGMKLHAGINDFFLFELDEIPSTGYIWNFRESTKGFEILSDTRVAHSTDTVGSPVTRHTLLKANKVFCHKKVHIKKQRPWDKEDFVKELTLHYRSTKSP